jgi:hypothetical protein
MPLPAAAQGQALVYAVFASDVLDIVERVIKISQTVTAQTEVQNRTTEKQEGPLQASVFNDRGLLQHQRYQLISVPPGMAANVQVICDVDGSPGAKLMGVRSAVDYATGEFRAVE